MLNYWSNRLIDFQVQVQLIFKFESEISFNHNEACCISSCSSRVFFYKSRGKDLEIRLFSLRKLTCNGTVNMQNPNPATTNKRNTENTKTCGWPTPQQSINWQITYTLVRKRRKSLYLFILTIERKGNTITGCKSKNKRKVHRLYIITLLIDHTYKKYVVVATTFTQKKYIQCS